MSESGAVARGVEQSPELPLTAELLHEQVEVVHRDRELARRYFPQHRAACHRGADEREPSDAVLELAKSFFKVFDRHDVPSIPRRRLRRLHAALVRPAACSDGIRPHTLAIETAPPLHDGPCCGFCVDLYKDVADALRCDGITTTDDSDACCCKARIAERRAA